MNSCHIRYRVRVLLCCLFLTITLCLGAFAHDPEISHFTWLTGITYEVPTVHKVVALTFDDGPSYYTPEILQLLHRYHAHATFFMIGTAMERYPQIVREVVANGQDVENHTYSHPRSLHNDSATQISHELRQCAATIKRITGVSPTLFRAPRGRVDENVIAVTSEQHYTVIGWSICGDHHEAKTPEQMAQRVLLHVHPGAIILLHDGSATMRRRDVQATAIILAALQRRGYRCISVPELLTLDRHKTTIESRGVLPEALDILHDL